MGRPAHLSPGPQISHGLRPRFRPERPFPAYAYVPGAGYPHPVRHPEGHSFGTGDEPTSWSDVPEQYIWGIDLFNHCYYWEAHEAWEPLWQEAERNSEERAFFKALILISAAGVKVRQGKRKPEQRHLDRAAVLLDRLSERFAPLVGMSPRVLARRVRSESRLSDPSRDRVGLDIMLEPYQQAEGHSI